MARMSSLDNNDFPAHFNNFQKTAEHCKKSLKLLIFTAIDPRLVPKANRYICKSEMTNLIRSVDINLSLLCCTDNLSCT